MAFKAYAGYKPVKEDMATNGGSVAEVAEEKAIKKPEPPVASHKTATETTVVRLNKDDKKVQVAITITIEGDGKAVSEAIGKLATFLGEL